MQPARVPPERPLAIDERRPRSVVPEQLEPVSAPGEEGVHLADEPSNPVGRVIDPLELALARHGKGLDRPVEHRLEQAVGAAEVMDHGPARDVGALGDRLERGPLEASFAIQLDRRIEDPAARGRGRLGAATECVAARRHTRVCAGSRLVACRPSSRTAVTMSHWKPATTAIRCSRPAGPCTPSGPANANVASHPPTMTTAPRRQSTVHAADRGHGAVREAMVIAIGSPTNTTTAPR